jgi:GDP-4-dehydro-6-deoxy-D-mannose reductase
VLDGRSDEVQARDLSTVRDFSDVRDIATGYVDIAERGTPGCLYNLCSGRATTVGELLDSLLAAAGLDRGVVRVLPDSGPGNVAYQVGSPSRVRAAVGWSTTIGLSRSVRALLRHIQQDLAR